METKTSNEDEFDPKHVLAAWCEAISLLYKSYSSIQTFIHGRTADMPTIGQCPVEQLVSLASSMQLELARLLIDMELYPTPEKTTCEEYVKKLLSHTLVLKRLNKQAQVKLLLASSPAS